MAEVAIAGTFPPPMRGMVCDVVDRRMLETEHVAKPVDADDEGARRLPLARQARSRASRSAICDQKTGAVLR